MKSDRPPGGHLPWGLDAPSGGGLAEFFCCLGCPHKHWYINALQFLIKTTDIPKGHGIPDMTQILPKCRQKAQRHRKGNRKTPGSAHPLQSSYELADAGGGNQIGAAGNAGEHQNEVGYRSKDCSQRTGQQRQQPVLYRQDSQICRQQPCQHGSFPLYQKENQIGYYTRTIPILYPEVAEQLRALIEVMDALYPEDLVMNGYHGFLFRNRSGYFLSAHNINRAIERISIAYNAEEMDQAELEDREPSLLPHFSVHNLRHTFCTRLCESTNDIKFIQQVMGHADFSTTMDIYTHITQENMKEKAEVIKGNLVLI